MGFFDDEDEEQQAAPAEASPLTQYRSEKPLDPTVRQALEQKYFAKPDLAAAKETASGNRRTASVVEGLGMMLGGKVDHGFFDGMRQRADGRVAQAEKEALRDKDVYRYLIDRDDKLKSMSASAEQAKAERASREKLAADKMKADQLRAEAEMKFKGDQAGKERWMQMKLAEQKLKQEAELKAADLAAAGSRQAAELAAKGTEVKPPTETQMLTANFGRKAQDADAIAGQFEAKGYNPSSRWRQVREAVPGGLATNDQDRGYQQAQKEFIAAILRKESGGAITPDEFTEYGAIYFPQPGDGPDVKAQKAAARKRATDNLISASGKAADAMKNSPFEVKTPSESGTAIAAPSKPLEEMTDEELDAYEASLKGGGR